jgi:4-amino-4-deoxy-L-arabinose transferase-like glycosyltransferase
MNQDDIESVVAEPQPRFRFAWRYVALALILLLAAFLRLWRLDSLPPGLYHDEAYNGLDALSLWNEETFPIFYEGWELYAQDAHQDRAVQQTQRPIFFEGNFGREPLHIYLMALSTQIFGPTPFAIRVVPAVAGVAAVFMTYLAAGILLGRGQRTGEGDRYWAWLPLFAAFIMAIFYPAITFSRFGLRAMLFVPISTAVVYFFWRGIRRVDEKLRDDTDTPFTSFYVQLGTFTPGWFIAAGFFLGLGLYTYAAARIFPFLFVAFVILWFWRDRQALRHQWGNMAVMVLTAFLVALPLLLFFLRYPYFFIFRSRFVANRGLGTFPGQPWLTWLNNIRRVGLGLVWEGEMNLRHNLPGRPFFDPVQSFFTTLGLVHIIQQRLRRHHVFLGLWFLVMILPSLLSGDAPHFGRMIGAAPPAAMLVALGADWLARTIGGRLSRQRDVVNLDLQDTYSRRFGIGFWVLVPLFLISAAITYRDYFQQYAGHPELDAAFYLSDWELGQYAAALPPDTVAYLSPTQEEMATIYFALGGEIERLRSFYSPSNTLVPLGNPGQAAVYLIRPQAEPTLSTLAAVFPQHTIEPIGQDFTAFLVEADAPWARAERESDASWGGAITLLGWSAEQEGGQLRITMYWQANVRMARSYTAYIHLLDQDQTLITQLDRLPDGYPTIDWQPGERVVDTYTLDLPPNFTPGTYLIQSGFYHLPSDERLGEPVILGGVALARP